MIRIRSPDPVEMSQVVGVRHYCLHIRGFDESSELFLLLKSIPSILGILISLDILAVSRREDWGRENWTFKQVNDGVLLHMDVFVLVLAFVIRSRGSADVRQDIFELKLKLPLFNVQTIDFVLDKFYDVQILHLLKNFGSFGFVVFSETSLC